MTMFGIRVKRWHKFAFGGLSLVLVGGIAWTISGGGPRKAADRPKCEGVEARRLGGKVGEVRHYSLTYEADLCQNDECVGLLHLSGDLEAKARSRAQNGDQTVELKFSKQVGEGEFQAELPSDSALSTPIYVTFAPSGLLVRVAYGAQVDASTHRLLESVVRELQVQSPTCGSPDERSWSGVESLAFADVLSHYTRNEKGSEITWKRADVAVWKDPDGLFSLAKSARKIISSDHAASIDEQGRVQRLRGRDEYALHLEGEDGEVRLRNSVALSEAHAPSRLQTASSSSVTGGPEYTLPAAHGELADKDRIAGHTVTSLLSELERGRRVEGSNGPPRSRMYVAAAALFRRDATAAEEAAELIRSGHPEKQFLLRALSDAGTPHTAELLGTILDGAQDTELAMATLVALGRVSSAGDEVVQAMASTLDDPRLAGTAQLMLGSLSYRTRETSPGASDNAVDLLVARYDQEKDVLARADTLRALGNAGSVSGLEVARRGAASRNPIERAAAAQALRRVPSDAADRLLATLLDDPESFVRRSALDAALYRDATELLTPSVARVARLETDATVRREAIRALVRWKGSSVEARTTLTWVARNDPEEDLRKVATEGLSRP